MVFCAAKAISQGFFFCCCFSCVVCLRGIQKLIWGINQLEKIKTPNLQFLEYPLHNPEPLSPQITQRGLRFWCSVRLCPAAVSERRCRGRLVDLCRVRTLDVSLPFVSACVCLPPASLAASSYNLLSQPRTVSSIPCSPCTISPPSASPPASLRITASHCLCVLLLLLLDFHPSPPLRFLFPSVLQLKGSPPSSHIPLIYFLLSVERVFCCCCCCCCSNVSPLSVFQVSPHFLWAVNMLTLTHLQPFCVSLHGMSCFRVRRVSLPVFLCPFSDLTDLSQTIAAYQCLTKRSPVSPGKKKKKNAYQLIPCEVFTGALDDEWLSSTSIGNQGLAAAPTAGAAYGSL